MGEVNPDPVECHSGYEYAERPLASIGRESASKSRPSKTVGAFPAANAFASACVMGGVLSYFMANFMTNGGLIRYKILS